MTAASDKPTQTEWVLVGAGPRLQRPARSAADNDTERLNERVREGGFLSPLHKVSICRIDGSPPSLLFVTVDVAFVRDYYEC